MNKRVLTLINDTESSYLLTEQEHKWYEKNLGNNIHVYTNMRFLPVGVRVNARNIS